MPIHGVWEFFKWHKLWYVIADRTSLRRIVPLYRYRIRSIVTDHSLMTRKVTMVTQWAKNVSVSYEIWSVIISRKIANISHMLVAYWRVSFTKCIFCYRLSCAHLLIGVLIVAIVFYNGSHPLTSNGGSLLCQMEMWDSRLWSCRSKRTLDHSRDHSRRRVRLESIQCVQTEARERLR